MILCSVCVRDRTGIVMIKGDRERGVGEVSRKFLMWFEFIARAVQ